MLLGNDYCSTGISMSGQVNQMSCLTMRYWHTTAGDRWRAQPVDHPLIVKHEGKCMKCGFNRQPVKMFKHAARHCFIITRNTRYDYFQKTVLIGLVSTHSKICIIFALSQIIPGISMLVFPWVENLPPIVHAQTWYRFTRIPKRKLWLTACDMIRQVIIQLEAKNWLGLYILLLHDDLLHTETSIGFSSASTSL